MDAFGYIYQAEEGAHAFIVYEVRTSTGKRFRNSEVHTVRGGKLVATEVYFGWDLPHRAPEGGFIENDGRGHAFHAPWNFRKQQRNSSVNNCGTSSWAK